MPRHKKLQFYIERHAGFMQLLQIGIQAQFVDGADSVGSDAKRNPSVSFGHIKTLLLQVRLEAALCFGVGVRDVVARNGAYACQLTNF